MQSLFNPLTYIRTVYLLGRFFYYHLGNFAFEYDPPTFPVSQISVSRYVNIRTFIASCFMNVYEILCIK